MRRAFELAALGRGHVSPNPMVGCVIVYQDKIIGEGFHHQYGQAHAEVNAINSVLAPNATVSAMTRPTGLSPEEILRQSTLYVTLEPCSHYGKTPPCAKKIIETGIPRVVVSCGDPNPEVNGQGIAMLREAGIEVHEHFLEQEGLETFRRFFTHITKNRPYVILKWAQSSDGYLSRSQGKPCLITGKSLQVLNHAYRVEEDAIMVGTGTILADNPRLNARMFRGKQPLRVSTDLHGKILKYIHTYLTENGLPEKPSQELAGKLPLRFFDRTQRTLLFVDGTRFDEYRFLADWPGTGNESLKIVPVKVTTAWPEMAAAYLRGLQKERIGSVIVEGGAALLQSFIVGDHWDEIRVFISDKDLGGGYAAPRIPPSKPCSFAQYGSEWVHVYRNKASESLTGM